MDSLRTPAQWAATKNLEIVRADGWETPGDARSFDEPITEAEFERRCLTSTIRMI